MEACPPPLSKWGNSFCTAKEAIEERIDANEHYLSARENLHHVPSLVDLAAERLANSAAALQDVESLDDVPPIILSVNIWRWHRIPYPALCRALVRLASEGMEPEALEGGANNVDEWILLNEKWLRDGNQPQWKTGLVTFSDTDSVFPDSILSQSGRTIARKGSLPGYELLCDAREPRITIQPSVEAFERTFEHMSDGSLKNLDWNNLFVAGGIVLGTLLSVDSREGERCSDPRWKSSDIDIYVYGLTPGEANQKLQHLFDTFCANLPAGTPTLVVRNCTTITFYARYPLRRIQIVLKLAESPKNILLNFDLDVCAMGWDGASLWMLPRAARALETGCSVFTMSLIRGHYLSDRRASTQERIFKYADKGYSIRILPSYLASLAAQDGHGEKRLSSVADGQRRLTEERIDEMQNRDDSGMEGAVSAWGSGGLLECLLPRFAGYRRSRCLKKGFKTFMRFVALWEMGRRGEVRLRQDIWASTCYQDAMTTYDDAPTPRYRWDERFDIAAFQTHMARANADELRNWADTDFHRRLDRLGAIEGFQRTASAASVDALLAEAQDIRMQVLLPCAFAAYANDVVRAAQARAGLRETALLVPTVRGRGTFDLAGAAADPQADGLFLWRVGAELMWQQLDRAVDEVFEALYAFRRVNEHLRDPPVFQARRLGNEFARRKVYSEFDAFAGWVGLEKKKAKKKKR
ncbi:hypothetical protein B0H17DRAFT_1328498 [Mycena rosella]|uniref:Uncharacterized protein n=1 Tax=Mycena rosella TaxID=1033263 RepID=A0AAD7GJZ6_MYCRO|nr:hypothetical protein B0H17DRAFT_1328498 [Mycena rosella]